VGEPLERVALEDVLVSLEDVLVSLEDVPAEPLGVLPNVVKDEGLLVEDEPVVSVASVDSVGSLVGGSVVPVGSLIGGSVVGGVVVVGGSVVVGGVVVVGGTSVVGGCVGSTTMGPTTMGPTTMGFEPRGVGARCALDGRPSSVVLGRP